MRPILVLGATGKTGRRVADRLEARGLAVRGGSRSAQPPFDWGDQTTWAAALTGVDAAYVSYYPDLATPGAPEAIAAFSQQAVDLGVRRLVLLSGRGEHEAQASEKFLQDSRADWTIVRSSWFNQNFSESFFLEQVLTGQVALPVGDIPEPFIDADDIADVAVAALTEPGHIGQVYEVTGPRLLTFADAVGEIAAATGRSIELVQVSAADYADAIRAAGLPEDVVEFLIYLFTTVLDGRNAHLTDGVQRALGREPRDFAAYARDVADAGTWTP